jgi:hypothetical protein
MNQRTQQVETQAAFDFLPTEMRHRLRFGGQSRANHADLTAQSRSIDRQTVHLGTRIAAARMREILRSVPTEITAVRPTALDLSQQRDALREIGTVVFYFREKSEQSQEVLVESQRLHPRPLPARYFDASAGRSELAE